MAFISLGLLAVGCAPADVAGNYTVSVTNGENDCGTSGWDPDATQSGIPVVITQDGDVVQVAVEGAVGVLLDLGVGSRLFNGTVGGSHIQGDLIGSVTSRQGECAYTYTLELDADLSGDVITGEIVYRPVTNHHADCGVLETCSNVQLFNGTRPPSE
jgi:hypothetical protein